MTATTEPPALPAEVQVACDRAAALGCDVVRHPAAPGLAVLNAGWAIVRGVARDPHHVAPWGELARALGAAGFGTREWLEPDGGHGLLACWPWTLLHLLEGAQAPAATPRGAPANPIQLTPEQLEALGVPVSPSYPGTTIPAGPDLPVGPILPTDTGGAPLTPVEPFPGWGADGWRVCGSCGALLPRGVGHICRCWCVYFNAFASMPRSTPGCPGCNGTGVR